MKHTETKLKLLGIGLRSKKYNHANKKANQITDLIEKKTYVNSNLIRIRFKFDLYITHSPSHLLIIM